MFKQFINQRNKVALLELWSYFGINNLSIYFIILAHTDSNKHTRTIMMHIIYVYYTHAIGYQALSFYSNISIYIK